MRRKLVRVENFMGRAAIVHAQAIRAGGFVAAAPFEYPGGVGALECGRPGMVQQANLGGVRLVDRKSTRLNSSHQKIWYAVFCLKKKKSASWWDRVRAQRGSHPRWRPLRGEL